MRDQRQHNQPAVGTATKAEESASGTPKGREDDVKPVEEELADEGNSSLSVKLRLEDDLKTELAGLSNFLSHRESTKLSESTSHETWDGFSKAFENFLA